MRRFVCRQVCFPPGSRFNWGAHSVCVIMLLTCPGVGLAANVLREAQVRIAMADPVTCEVTEAIALALDHGGDIEQRLQRLEGSRVELLRISGAEQTAAPRRIGVTEALVIRFPTAGDFRYEVRYRVRQPDEWAYRCPLWVPAVASDGRSRSVEIEVTLPPAARPAGWSFPAFQWTGGTGRITLGNLPAFVRLPYLAPGEARPPTRNLGRIMDVAAVGVLLAGTAWWIARRRW